MPGTSTFHATFSVVLHFSGTPVAADIPCPVLPRNSGQSLSAAKVGRTMSDTAMSDFMGERYGKEAGKLPAELCHAQTLENGAFGV